VRGETAAGFDGGEAAEGRRRYVNALHLVNLARAEAKFENGVLVELVERPDEAEQRMPCDRYRTPQPLPLTILRVSCSVTATAPGGEDGT
jgi:hypothetical protein